ncbi:oligosaccharide flippase family protein [Clostridium sp. YIM B02515]|uniref:Oligosaccharide flippase family protein n=1 Tax=Clostridium rhizosphaerae TaxID=2803861 RepID=A0ABS1TFI7_9CLOT|nr:oligosaccharide flippase family protein [Clostridium rhizosphaerae]MBL4938132.1 oligosaccharide flippase family protein [Clostridium rhizosphaerae]
MFKAIVNKASQNTLIKSGFWYTIGNFFLQGISFITIPIFTRLLNTDNYGVVNLYSTWQSTFMYIISLGLASSVSKAKHDFKEDYDGYLSSILFLSIISLIVAVFLGCIFKNSIAFATQLPVSLIMILIFQSFFAYVVDYVSTKYTIEYQYKKYLFISISSTVLNVILSIVLILSLTQNKYIGRIGGGFVVTSVYGIVLLILILVKGKKLINIKYWKYALALSLPLIPHSISGLILSQFDRILIRKYVGFSATGIYSFAYNMGMIVSVVWASTNKAWVPWFFEQMDKRNVDDIKQKMKYYIILFSVIVSILIFVSPELVMMMSSKGFWEGLKLVPIIMISYFFVFLYSLPVNYEFYMKKTYLISIGTFLSGFINIILNLLLIPKYGYIAGAYTTLVSYILLFLYHYIIANVLSKGKLFETRYFVFSIVFIFAVAGMFYILKSLWVIRYIIIITGITLAFYIIKNKIQVILLKK